MSEANSANTRYYPAMLDVRGKRAIVIGGGKISARKAAELAACGAIVEVIDPTPCADIEALVHNQAVTLTRAPYQNGDLSDATVAIVATSDVAVQEAAWSEAQRRGILVNTVDKTSRCSFIVPSILRRGPLTIAVSTDGTNPSLARRIRERLEVQFPQAYGPFLELAAHARRRLRAAGLGYNERDKFMGELVTSEVLALIGATNEAEAEKIVSRLLSEYGVAEP
jgi:precorrin-2 dehydrogenase / sirohydrochlorin ferrochelatase